MMKWSGDGRFYLPARQIEPYRLWFEFLKAASSDPAIRVDENFYSDWGDYKNQSFNEWWTGDRWKHLFAIDCEVRVLDESDMITNSDTAIVVRLPLKRDPRETIADVETLLEYHRASSCLTNPPRGKFALTKGYERGFAKLLLQMRALLRIYQIWLSHDRLQGRNRLAQTAVDFVQWTQSRRDLITKKKYKYEKPYLPSDVAEFAKMVMDGEKPASYTEERDGFKRQLRKAKNLARNAASGDFPGKWT
jgi:hypothetical protein